MEVREKRKEKRKGQRQRGKNNKVKKKGKERKGTEKEGEKEKPEKNEAKEKANTYGESGGSRKRKRKIRKRRYASCILVNSANKIPQKAQRSCRQCHSQ